MDTDMAMDSNGRKPLVLTVLGCGTLGTAIVSGMLEAAAKQSEKPALLPTKIIACVTSETSAKRIHDKLDPLISNLEVLRNDNLKGAQEGDVILLGCKPWVAPTILENEEISKALDGKLLISIMAGTSTAAIYSLLKRESDPNLSDNKTEAAKIVRVMPNTASAIGHSMTVISAPDSLPQELKDLVDFIFSSIGRTISLPEKLMDVSTSLVGSGPAFFALVLEAAIDGAVAMGLPRKDAQMMAAQTMKGAAELVLSGEHPTIIRDKISTPGGTTIGGLLILEEGGVRGSVAKAVREAATIATELGKGRTNVNSTRYQSQT